MKNKKKETFPEWKKSMKASLDEDITKEMSKCIYDLTTTGNSTLDEGELKKFKKFCRKSDDYVRFAFILIMEQLSKKHSEIRLSAFQVAVEIFTRSHAFRDILVTYLQDFFALTTGTETGQPLPPPKAAANKLKESTLRTVQQWYDNYGKSYRKLDVGYNYLKNCKHVDFQNIQARNEAEWLRFEQEERRKQKQIADRLAKVLKVIAENKQEIVDCISEAENCLKLLLPTPENFQLFSPADATQPNIFKGNTDQSKAGDESLPLLRNCDPGEDNSVKTSTRSKNIVDPGFAKSLSESERTLVDTNENVSLSEAVLNTNSDSKQTCQRDGVAVNTISSSTDDDSLNCKGQEVGEMGDAPGSGVEEISNNDLEDEIMSEDEDDYDSDEMEEDDRAHGFGNQGVSINIEIPVDKVAVKETEDNTDVLQSLKDAAKLINATFLPRVTKWLEVLGKNGGNQNDIKSIIDIKLNLESIKTKCTELKLLSMEKQGGHDTDDDDDDDLEDVPEKEGYEATVPVNLEPNLENSSLKEVAKKPGLKRYHSGEPSTSNSDSKSVTMKKANSFGHHWSLKERDVTEDLTDPTSRAAALARIRSLSTSDENKPSTSSSLPSTSKPESSKPVPYVEFGKDLAFWENPDQIEAPEIVKMDSLHRFWASGEKETEKTSQHDVGLVLNRTFKFTGQFEPVKWSCRAPLKGGKLCPRMDRIKCPFHGPIIPRDEKGDSMVKNEPGTSSTTARLQSDSEVVSELPPWRDPELQREIEHATGHDLGSNRSQKMLEKAANKGKGKGKGKGKRKSGLTNIRAACNTSRRRLEKKVFNKRSMRKVCTTLDTADYKRVRDKFGNQFNYSL